MASAADTLRFLGAIGKGTPETAALLSRIEGGEISEDEVTVTRTSIPTGLAKLGANITKAITGSVVEKVSDDGTALKEVNAELEDFYSKAGSKFEVVTGTGLMAAAALGVAAAALPAGVAASSAGAVSPSVGSGAALGGAGLGAKVIKAAKPLLSNLAATTMENPGPPVPSAPASSKLPAWLMPVAVIVGIYLFVKNFF